MKLPSLFRIARLFYDHPSYMIHQVMKKFAFRSRYAWITRHPKEDHAVPPPLVYKFLLTMKCNLRCSMCMLWGDCGWIKNESPTQNTAELDWETFRTAIRSVQSTRPSFVFSGGEPLLYSHFTELTEYMRTNKIIAYVCTNGTLLHTLDEKMLTNSYVSYLISLDGLRTENDMLRGAGTYDRVVENIRRIKSYKRPPYIGLQFTVRPENVGTMHAFCKEMRTLNVDWILLNLCWFISPEQGQAYEETMRTLFNITAHTHTGYQMPYPLNAETFCTEYKKICAETWPFQISCYLDKPEDMYQYLKRPDQPTGNTFCYKQWIRLDVLPSGDVAPCIQFPDYTIGNIKDTDILSLWNSPQYAHFRSCIRKKCLPICSKCDAVYLYDAQRKYL